MTKATKQISGGLYLVLDPSMELDVLLKRLENALEGGVQLIQIWNNWPADYEVNNKKEFADKVVEVCREYAVPILVNEEWELLLDSHLAGVHFDHIPENFTLIKEKLPNDALIGITCGNDLGVVEWAEKHGLDYVSFCAMFPSNSVDSCEIVSPDTVRKARAITSMPLFVSGGITPENIYQFKELDISGAAVISGIMNHDTSKEAAFNYNKALKDLLNEKITLK